MRYHKIPDESIRRLPAYLRALLYFSRAGKPTVSSTQLADFLHVNPSQIRKDFSYFGYFGTRGKGYEVDKLIKQTRSVLKLKDGHKAALIGAGNLGKALMQYDGFGVYGLDIAAVFDADPLKIGKTISGKAVLDIAELRDMKENGITLGIITVPGPAAQEVADRLVEAGVMGILNFAPVHLDVPKRVKVITIDIAMELGRLPYYA
jgi:redox-sensing transcriptional repressor